VILTIIVEVIRFQTAHMRLEEGVRQEGVRLSPLWMRTRHTTAAHHSLHTLR
jgi:hypothetical protein